MIGFKEFVALMAALMSLTALSLDAMLPALSVMGEALGVKNESDIRFVISVVFLGISLGQLIYGALADSFGRKRVMYLGLSIFIVGSLISHFATTLSVMLIGRFLQGIGAAAPRIVNLAIIRDMYSGRTMAQMMSFIMTVFIFVPALAPLLGQSIMHFAGWREIFSFFVLFSFILFVWFAFRQQETLRQENRQEFSLNSIYQNSKIVFSYKDTLVYTTISSFVLGAFIGFLSSVEHMFKGLYELGDKFPFYFAILALSLGLASFFNGKVVVRLGTRYIVKKALLLQIGISILFLPFLYMYDGVAPLFITMPYFMGIFFCNGLLFGNVNSLAMEPLGKIAGIGASIIGSISTLAAVPMGMVVSTSFDTTLYPLVIAFLLVGLFSLPLIRKSF